MFWDKFITLCNKIGKKPNPVAAELKISSGSITKWKNGGVPSDPNLKKIADYFGVPVEYFKSDFDTAEPPVQDKRRPGIRIPVYGEVAAGLPILAIENYDSDDPDDWEEIDEKMARGGDYIALRIHGDSMEPKISNGDVVIVRLQPDIESGEIAVVRVNGESATCKKIKKTPDGIMLISSNPGYDPMFYSNREILELPVTIIGKVVELRAKF